MAIVGAIRRLLALPLLLAGRLLAMVSPPSCVGFYKAAWAVSGDGQTAVLALQAIGEHFGTEMAAATALAWMTRRPRPEIAALAGLLALQQADGRTAAEWLARGRQAGQDTLGNLELLEYLLTVQRQDAHRTTELARQLDRRRDLHPQLSRLIHEELLWDDMFGRNFAEAGQRARRLLEIEDLVSATAALWALAEQSGSDAAAQAFHRQLAAAPEPVRLYWESLGSFAIGRQQRARETLDQLRQSSESLARVAARVLRERGMPA